MDYSQIKFNLSSKIAELRFFDLLNANCQKSASFFIEMKIYGLQPKVYLNFFITKVGVMSKKKSSRFVTRGS